MSTINRIVHFCLWSPERVKNYNHFKAIVSGWGAFPDLQEKELEEAYEIITGRQIKKNKPSKTEE